MYLFFPIAMFGMIITQFGQAAASATRIFEILDAKVDVTDKPDAMTLPQVQGHVRFENVSFRYFGGAENTGASEAVLKNMDFEALPGQTIALLGATGSGKTSIINLLPRFYDPTQGRILIDGYDIRDVTLDSLRSQIGIVLQETTLFAGTIRDNIAFGKPEATMQQVIAAARAAAAHDFITDFPDGYETRVGERGGDPERRSETACSHCRAPVAGPAHPDPGRFRPPAWTWRPKAHIQEALDLLMKGRTSFVIAQRISTVMSADQILVLDRGQIVAHGKHAELLEDSEIYAEIYSSQLVGVSMWLMGRKKKTTEKNEEAARSSQSNIIRRR